VPAIEQNAVRAVAVPQPCLLCHRGQRGLDDVARNPYHAIGCDLAAARGEQRRRLAVGVEGDADLGQQRQRRVDERAGDAGCERVIRSGKAQMQARIFAAGRIGPGLASARAV
jgi:hypothetical protein